MRGARVPISTYRLQLEPDLTFDGAAAQVDYLAALGISQLYLSPVLQAAPGSKHGYDVTDPTRLAEGLGGQEAFQRLVTAAHDAGLGIVVDVVPNHMTTPTPLSLNRPLWSVLREGRSSPYAAWFDIDWDAQDGRVLLPVLGGSLEQALGAGEITVGESGGEWVVRYFEHVFPLAPGTEHLVAGEPGGSTGSENGSAVGHELGDLLAAQHYRLASWRLGSTDLNYRRFFDVTSLIAVRVEDPEVFDATHRLVLDLLRSGAVSGLRIDHPDGLADPAGYLARLAEATGDAWVVVEKILEGSERLPGSWRTAGTTGYDALLRIGGLFVDPAASGDLTALADAVVGEHQDLARMERDAKLFVVRSVLPAEVDRLMRVLGRALPDTDPAEARRVVEALLVGMDRYRVYVSPDGRAGEAEAAALEQALARGTGSDDPTLDPGVARRVLDLALGRAAAADDAAQAEFVVRFQQTCGPVMAKAVEDTVFYRYVRLVALNEVGGDPGRLGVTPSQVHAFAQSLSQDWPTAMTTLSTHDTKRSEDVRARLYTLSERPDAWADWLRQARRIMAPHRPDGLDPTTEYLLWQTLVGAWPITQDRLRAYALKATREAKVHTTWTDPDPAYEQAVDAFVSFVVSDPAVVAHVEGWLRATAAQVRANTLGQKLVQLTMPGVPDVYQGTELVDLSLVDPDNRRPVDVAERRRRLASLDAGMRPADLSGEKLLVTAAALRTRRDLPECFVGPDASYLPIDTGSAHAFAFGRGVRGQVEVVTVVTRLAGQLGDAGGFGDAIVDLPGGHWADAVSGRTVLGGATAVRDLIGRVDGLPVALLVRVRNRA